MTARIALALFVSFALVSCGVKSDLERPSGEVLKDHRTDPSKPPIPLGDPGGTIPPYPTGP
jgi:hypothetical protein